MITNLTNLFMNEVLALIDTSTFPFGEFEGWYGSIHKVESSGKLYALKVFKDIMHEDVSNGKLAAYDYEILKTLNNSEHYPTIHAYKERDWMLVDWIDGVPFRNVPNKELYFSQLYKAYKDAVQAGWLPDDVKGDNLVYSNGKLMIIDVGSYLPVIPDLDYNIGDRVEFVINHAHIYPSIRDKAPYII